MTPYERPELEFVEIKAEDVVCASPASGCSSDHSGDITLPVVPFP